MSDFKVLCVFAGICVATWALTRDRTEPISTSEWRERMRKLRLGVK